MSGDWQFGESGTTRSYDLRGGRFTQEESRRCADVSCLELYSVSARRYSQETSEMSVEHADVRRTGEDRAARR